MNEINLNESGYAEAKNRNQLSVALNWPWERQRQYKNKCPKHGTHEPLSTNELSIEYQGVEYVPRDDAEMSYCPDCLGEYRQRHIDLNGAADEAVVEHIVTGGTNWREFRDGFEIAYLEELGDLEYCPFCGSEFTATNQKKGRVTCPNHGKLNLSVKHLEPGNENIPDN